MRSYGGQTSVGRLRRVLVCDPVAAGWERPEVQGAWRTRGFLRGPVTESAAREHRAMVELLRAHDVAVEFLEELDDLDAVYVHDASWMLDDGALLLRPGKPNRRSEPAWHAAHYRRHGIPIVGRVEAPATAEGGDLVWLDPGTVLAGRGYRTNAAGIEQLGALLADRGIELIRAPLPHSRGPDHCLHLMSLLSPLDASTCLVDRELLAVETLELLEGRGQRLLAVHPSERETLAGNVLPLGNGTVMLLAGNPRTAETLAGAGFEVLELTGDEIGVVGAGGPTCLTRPLWRDA